MIFMKFFYLSFLFIFILLFLFCPLVTLSRAWGGSVSSPNRLLLAWGAARLSGPTHEASEVPGLDKFLNFVL